MRRLLLTACLLLTLTACGGEDSSAELQQLQDRVNELEAERSSSPSPEPVAAPPASEPTEQPTPEPTPEPTVDFLMPDLVGQNLQVAQNKIQELGVFFSVSHDLLGARNQLLDSNWKVCNQTPTAGTPITGLAADWEGKIDFGVVKLEETCP